MHSKMELIKIPAIRGKIGETEEEPVKFWIWEWLKDLF